MQVTWREIQPIMTSRTPSDQPFSLCLGFNHRREVEYSLAVEVKEQSFSQDQAEARRDVQGAGATIRETRSSHGSGTKMTASSRPGTYLTLSAVDLWKQKHVFVPQQKWQRLHPLYAVCFQTMGHPHVQLWLSCQRTKASSVSRMLSTPKED